jgi:hypothetical protein
MMRHSFTLLLLLFACCLAQAQEVLSFPLAYHEGKPTVRMILNGKPVALLLDTGSDLTILNEKIAPRMGFRTRPLPRGKGEVKGIGFGTTNLEVALGAQLEVAGRPLFTPILSTDLSQVDRGFSPYRKVPLAGIIGADLMQQYGLVIDYEAAQVQMQFDVPLEAETLMAREP